MTVRALLLGSIAVLVSSSALAAGKCDTGGAYGASVAAAREAVRASCDCDGAPSHSAYLKCAWQVIQQLTTDGALPRTCRSRVRQFALRSTCGRTDQTTCCVKTGDRPWRGVIRSTARGCRPTGNDAAWCNASFPHVENACLPDSGCRSSACGDGIVEPGEQCEPPRTRTCDFACRSRDCGNGVVEPETEQCEPPNTATCDDQCYFIHACGNGVVDAGWGEECEPPNTATCDAQCHFVHTCGNRFIEPGEECDGQPGCSSGCTLTRSVCCDFGDACLGGTVQSDFDAYFSFFKQCFLLVGGTGSYGVCQGDLPCPPPAPPDIGCRIGSCQNVAIDPTPICCQEIDGTCRDTVATTAAGIGGFGCSTFPPPTEGDVPRLMLGTCGTNGRCVPAN